METKTFRKSMPDKTVATKQPKIFSIFDADYDVREDIGYVEAESWTDALIITIRAVECIRVPRILEDAQVEPFSITDYLIHILAIGYTEQNIQIEEVDKIPAPEGLNYIGRLNDHFE